MKHEQIKNFIRSFKIFEDIEIEDFIHLSTTKTINKNDYFIKEGENCQQVAFVLSGIFRSYYTLENGTETTYCITFPNNLMAAYSSVLTGQKSQENIQAITQTEVLLFPWNEIKKLASQSTNWLAFLKIIAEQQYIELEKRVFQLQRSNANKRYADLIINQPEYLKHIPLHYLASYLGISQRHLSRIRKEVCF